MNITLFLIGFFATFALTWSVAVDDSEGPFRVYQFVRWAARREFVPALIRENASCPYCVSFWVAALVTLLLPLYTNLSWVERSAVFFVATYGFHGAVVFWFRWLKIFYGVSANES